MSNQGQGGNKFGTFGGVFTPCTLTILGVIMFLRYGQVVGEAGLFNALIILGIAKCITTLTTLSLSAIATNTKVKGGGAYFLISRSLGVEFGSAIGIVFFLAQAISVAMYVVGFSEAFVAVFPDLGFSLQGVASFVNLVVFICVWIGAGWTIKVQYFILAVLGLSLVSFTVGSLETMDMAKLAVNMEPHYKDGSDFFTMFALFFPAVTGIMAGANMSGDLKDPGYSIPVGTLGSIVVTSVIYGGMAVLLAMSATNDQLLTNNMIVQDMAWIPWMITAGVFAATLSSALGSMMGAPRILQAFARDGIFPILKPFRKGQGKNNEPRAATVITFVIAEMAVLMGDLNAIAPIITMAFMITYGTLNLATFYESITKNPSYRPSFRYSHWSSALMGAVGCIGVMFLIAPLWALVSIIFMALLHAYISRREIESRWGDVHSGIAFERTRKNLLKLEEELEHPKNWRPIILTLSGGAWNRFYLAKFGHWLTAGHGILTIAQIIVGDTDQIRKRQAGQEEMLKKFIRDADLQAFPAVVTTGNFERGIEALVQCHGLGSLRPNTVLLGWPADKERVPSFFKGLQLLKRFQRSIIVFSGTENEDNAINTGPGTIDVWWRGEGNGSLMVLLAHLLTQNPVWRNREIRLIRMISNEAGRDEVNKHLEKLAKEARIKASYHIIVSDSFKEALKSTSKESAITFLGFEVPDEGEEAVFDYYTELIQIVDGNVFMVSSAGGMELVI